ncbi:MAG: LPP20 family lipoprotein [Thermodesulfobacteriota bacterium]|nr:LPP20 family lipoprotein [Thermodesulfobacteriota bacterium]
MKKIMVAMTVLAFGSLFFFGCATTPEESPAEAVSKVESEEYKTEYSNAPSWVIDGGSSMEGGSAAVGSAKIGKAGMNFARTEALANGRDELSRQIGVKIKNLLKNFTQTTGIGDSETVEKVTSHVSKQVSKQTLIGSRQKEAWISPSSELYVLVVIDPSTIRNTIKDSVQTSLRNEQALWQMYQAKKAHEELEKEIEKEFGEFKNQ